MRPGDRHSFFTPEFLAQLERLTLASRRVFRGRVKGERKSPRRGRKDGYDTNMTGRAGQMGSRLQYLGVIGQYRKMMEDAIARESVPRDFHSQIKDYFQALDER